MGREILFRGKRKDNGQWVEGYYQQRYDAFENIQHLIFWAKSYTVWEYAEVDPETVCQYTGLTDKNGRKIFEGDVISKRVSTYSLDGLKPTGEMVLVGTVIWDDSSTIHPSEWDIKVKDEHGNDTIHAFDNRFEVIGNIFDNPELLNQ